MPPPIISHNRVNSTTLNVRELASRIQANPSDNAPPRGITPSPRELFGSSTSYPLKDRDILQPREYSSSSFRSSMDFDRGTSLPPIRRPSEVSLPAPVPSHIGSSAARDEAPAQVTVHDINKLSSQLTGITTIASNLQREMTNLSRRSKDNATDLMALKEAGRNRDEEIRRSLRDLQSGLTSFDATDRLLDSRYSHLSLAAPSTSSGSDRGSNYGDDTHTAPKIAAASTHVLEKVLREMPTKDEQDRALDILRDIQESLKSQKSQGDKSEAEEKILSVLEEIRDREESRGKEVALVGPRSLDDEERVMNILEDLRQDLRKDKSGEEKIISILEEIREKETEDRSDERILSALDELKGKAGDERLDRVITLLEELRDRDPDEKVVSMLEEVRVKLEIMSEDFGKHLESPTPTTSVSAKSDDKEEATPAESLANDEILALLKIVQDGINHGGVVSKDIKRIVEDWNQIWSGHDKTIADSMKDLGGQIEVLSAVQRAAIARMPTFASLGLPSQALATINPPLPPDLDNEAAITALANIAATTTRTDITLSSINAFIKVFQKESYQSNTNTAESMATLGRFMEEFGQALGSNNVQNTEIRKVLEVVRTGMCSGNDKLVEFEHRTTNKIDDLTELHKALHRTIMGDDEEALWKVDLGVKDDVEALTRKIDGLCDKNVAALKSASENTIEAINSSSPVALVEELKNTLGAMAQRSLDAFKNSEEAIQRLTEETTTSAERSIEAIQNVNSTVALADFRAEFKDMAEKSYAICEAINAKCGESEEVKDIIIAMKLELSDLVQNSVSTIATDSADIKAAIEKMQKEIDAKMEDSLTSAVAFARTDESDKTTAALVALKAEVSDTLCKAVAIADKDDSEKILNPIRELRQEIMQMIEKSNSALAAPVHYPEADEIKSRIERLAKELFHAMEKTADLVAETGLSNGDSGYQIKQTVDALRKDIGTMGSSIAAAVASNSAAAVEEGIKGAFADLKQSVLVKVEQGLVTSDKAVSCIAELSQQTRDSINELKKEVIEMMNKSISMAVATVNPQDSPTPNRSLLDALEIKITDVIISAMAASTNSDELRELIEGLKIDIDGVGRQIAKGPDDGIKKLLEELKVDVTGIVSAASSHETKRSLDDLRKEVQRMMENTSSMIPPGLVPSNPSNEQSIPVEKLEKVISTLKEDVNDMVERSLASALASCTYDSEESVKEAIEELKRDVRDTLEKSMVPLPHQAHHESSKMIREAMESLRQDLSSMFNKRAIAEAEDREEMVGKLDALKDQFGDLLEKSTNVEFKEAVDVLKIQVHGLLERSSGAEYADLKEMIRALNGQIVVREPMPADDEVNVILEALRGQVEELAGKFGDEDVKATLDALKADVAGLSNKQFPAADNSELKVAIESLNSRITGLSSNPTGDSSGLREAVDEIRLLVGSIAKKDDADDLMAAIDSFKSEFEGAVEKSTTGLSKASDVTEVRFLIEDFRREFSAAMAKRADTINTGPFADALETVKNDLKILLEKPRSAPAFHPASVNITQVKEVKDAVDGLRREFKDVMTRSGLRIFSPKPGSDFAYASATTPDSLDVKEAVTDISSAVGECRVEVAIVKALLEEKSAENDYAISGVTKAVGESRSEAKLSISAVKETVYGVKEAIEEFRSESKEGVAGVKEVVDGLKNVTSEAFNVTSNSVSELRIDARGRIAEVKSVVDAIREETKDGMEEVNKTVESAQVDVKEVVTSLDKKIDVAHVNVKEAISEVKAAVGDSRIAAQEGFTVLTTTIAASQNEAKEAIAGVKKLFEDSQSTVGAEHEKTQQKVVEVLSLVDDLQSEWKGHQPSMLDALADMKQLLLEAQEAQRAAADKPEIELPPTYDDSRAQDKLDMLIAGAAAQAKHLPQLDLLETITKHVSASSASISDFLEHQKLQTLEDATSRIFAARQAELDHEKATTERRLVEAATERLRDEHDKLQVSVEILQEETEELRERKLGLTSELAGIETALTLRREELLMLEARGEALERRMLDGIIEQSRNMLKPKSAKRITTLRNVKNQPPKPRFSPAPAERRHFSQSQAGMNRQPSRSGRSSLGLGQSDYSASLGLLGRSQSVKQSSYTRKSSVGGRGTPMMDSRPPERDEDVEFEEYEHESEYEEGSVIKNVKADEDDEDEDGLSKRVKAYPALGLDFGNAAPSSRSASGFSSMA